jgi:hypothetical protein
MGKQEKEEGVGKIEGSLSTYIGNKYQTPAPQALKLACSQWVMRMARLDYPNPY